jgi:hypothetical protein
LDYGLFSLTLTLTNQINPIRQDKVANNDKVTKGICNLISQHGLLSELGMYSVISYKAIALCPFL